MSYCGPSDVRLIIETSLTDDELETLIEMSDAEIDRGLGAQPVDDRLISKLSMLLTAITVRGRDPESFAAGEYREQGGSAVESWRREAEEIKRLYRSSLRRV